MQTNHKKGRPPNNRLGYGVQPTIIWDDKTILDTAASTNDRATVPGSTAHAREVRSLFEKHNVPAPTPWAVIQWVRRGNIPDRWRATVVYLLMLDKRLMTGKLFRRAPAPAIAPATSE